MEIPEEHKKLLRILGLDENDLKRFDGTYITYEFDPEKGVRLYDPYYDTSYNEYIGIDGWSAWSSEGDTFMSDIMGKAGEKAAKEMNSPPPPDREDIRKALRKKFGGKNGENEGDS